MSHQGKSVYVPPYARFVYGPTKCYFVHMCCVCVCSGVIVLCFVVFDVVIVLQSLVVYGLYPYVLDQLDATLEVSSCAGVSIHHCHGQWRGECHVVSSLQVKTLVLSVVAESSEWEKHLVENVVPVLACLKNGAGIKVVSVEGEVLVGKAIAASLASDTPLVVGMVTARTLFEEIRRQFLVEFSGLDPLSILEYFRVRLMPSVRERFLDRMPNFRQVSKK